MKSKFLAVAILSCISLQSLADTLLTQKAEESGKLTLSFEVNQDIKPGSLVLMTRRWQSYLHRPHVYSPSKFPGENGETDNILQVTITPRHKNYLPRWSSFQPLSHQLEYASLDDRSFSFQVIYEPPKDFGTKPIVFLAGGFGITRPMGIIKSFIRRENPPKMYLLYSISEENQIHPPFRVFLQEKSREQRLDYTEVITHKRVENRISENHVQQILEKSGLDAHFVISGGNVLFEQTMVRYLRNLGVENERIIYSPFPRMRHPFNPNAWFWLPAFWLSL